MKKEGIAKMIVASVAIGMAVAIAFFCSFLAYQSVANPTFNKSVATESVDNQQTSVGYIDFGNAQTPIYIDANYSSMAEGASLLSTGNMLGENGQAFVHVFASNSGSLQMASKGDTITAQFNDNDYNYEFVKSFTADNQQQVLSNSFGINKCLVVYMDEISGNGLSGKYTVFVFKQVD